MADCGGDLERWFAPFLARLGHKARRRMCPLYVAGRDCKSVEPMASRWAPGDCDQLHHFVASDVWDEALLEEELAIQADKLIGGVSAVLLVDDTALPKKGSHSVGVAPQYASALGKTANCQTLVSQTLAGDEIPVMIGLRPFLPESWTGAPELMAKARVPENWRAARTKPEIALAEIDRIRAAGRVPPPRAPSESGASGDSAMMWTRRSCPLIDNGYYRRCRTPDARREWRRAAAADLVG